MKTFWTILLATAAGIGLGFLTAPRSVPSEDQAPRRASWSVLSQRVADMPEADRWEALVGEAKSTDPDWASLLASAGNDWDLQKLLAREWAKAAPQQFWNHLLEHRDSLVAEMLRPVLLEEWALSDPEAAWAALDDLPRIGVHAKNTRSTLIRTVLEADLEGGMALAEHYDHGNSFGWGGATDSRWIARDPEKAARLVAGLPERSHFHRLLRDALEVWVREDPEESLEWARQNLTLFQKASAMPDMVGRLWEDGRRAETLALIEKSSGKLKIDLAKPVLNRWVKEDAEAALAWLKNQFGNEALLRAIAFPQAWEGADEVSLFSEIFENAPKHWPYFQSVARFGRDYWRQSPEDAISWLDQIDATGAKMAYEEILKREADSAQAADWAARAPLDHPFTAALLGAVAVEKARSDTDAARTWLESLPSDRAAIARKPLDGE